MAGLEAKEPRLAGPTVVRSARRSQIAKRTQALLQSSGGLAGLVSQRVTFALRAALATWLSLLMLETGRVTGRRPVREIDDDEGKRIVGRGDLAVYADGAVVGARLIYTRTSGVRHLFAACGLSGDKLAGHIKPRKTWALFLEFCRYLRSVYPP